MDATCGTKEPLINWLLPNVYRMFLYHTVVCLGIAAAFTWKDFSLDRYLEAFYLYWTFGGVLGLPGMAVWLGFNAVVPVTWSGAWRRAVAIATSPLIQAWWLWAFLSLELVEPAILFGIVLPAGAGSVIRLRGRTPEWSGLLVPVGGRTQRTTP